MNIPFADARIVVGMPVYNAADTVASAIASILAYPANDLRLVISDNASTDETPRICGNFARDDRRVVFVRQARNIGAASNFDLVLAAARSRYFMWAAADDVRSPDFIGLCAGFLDRNDDYVGATCPTRFKGQPFDPIAMGDASLDDPSPHARMLMMVGRMHANGRFYSLLRRDALAGWPEHGKTYLGADWTLVLRLLRAGKMKRLDAGWVELGNNGASRRLTIFASNRKRLLHWPLPFLDFSREALSAFTDAPPADKARLWAKLAVINAIGATMQVRYEARLRFRNRLAPALHAPPGPPR